MYAVKVRPGQRSLVEGAAGVRGVVRRLRRPAQGRLGSRGDRNTLMICGMLMMRFSNRLVAERVQPFWEALQAGEFLTDAAALAGTHRWRGLKWLREEGGVRPRRGRDLKGRCLSFAEREEIALGRAGGETMTACDGEPDHR